MRRAIYGAAAAASFAEAQTCTGFCVTLQNIGADLADWSGGCMLALQTNPDDTTNFCYEHNEVSKAEVINLFDLDTYNTPGQFDFFEALDKYSVMQIALM